MEKGKKRTNTPGSSFRVDQPARSGGSGARTGTPRTVQRGSGPVSPDYQRKRQASIERAPTYKTPSGSGKKFAREQSQYDRQVRYDRERRGAADDRTLEAMKQGGSNQRQLLSERGQNQRQRLGFVQALEKQARDFGQKNQQQQALFGQQSAMQQERFGQQTQQQQNVFGQQTTMQQNRFDQQNKRDSFLAGQEMQQPNKVGTIRTYENSRGDEQRYDSRTGEDFYPFSPIPFADRLNSGQ